MWTDLSSVLSQYTRVTDRRSDGRRDGRTDRILIAIPRLHYMQRGKNANTKFINMHACIINVSTRAHKRQINTSCVQQLQRWGGYKSMWTNCYITTVTRATVTRA